MPVIFHLALWPPHTFDSGGYQKTYGFVHLFYYESDQLNIVLLSYSNSYRKIIGNTFKHCAINPTKTKYDTLKKNRNLLKQR